MVWDPNIYLAFAGHRFRPAIDLISQISVESPRRIVDLGCGTGSAARLMRQRWPDAAIAGVDGSPEMLAKARSENAGHDIAWIEADLNAWQPDEKADIVFSNAALHWLDGHATLFPRLVKMVAPGGRLAVQMPRNESEPGIGLVNETALDGPWRDRLEKLIRPGPVAEPKFYYDLLAPLVGDISIWETRYVQVLEGDNPVADWTRGARMAPLLAALDEPQRSDFETEYRRRVAAAYPKESDDKTLFPFRRLFFVATM